MKLIIGFMIVFIATIIIYVSITKTEKKIEFSFMRTMRYIINNLQKIIYHNQITEEKFTNNVSDNQSPNINDNEEDSDSELVPDYELPNPDLNISDISGSPSIQESNENSELVDKDEAASPVSSDLDSSSTDESIESNEDTSDENQISTSSDNLNISDDTGMLNKLNSHSIEDILNKYMDENKSCNAKLINDKSYENKFTNSFKNYVSAMFKDKLNYIPEFTRIESLNKDEFNLYIEIVSSLPKCDILIDEYDQKLIDNNSHNDIDKINYNSIENISSPESSTLNSSPEISTENISSPESSTLNSSQGNSINRENVGNVSPSPNTEFDNTDKLRQNQDIMNKIVKNSEGPMYVDSNNTESKMFSDQINKVEIGKKFNFKQDINFDHNEPSRKIASAYGWSYMPPQTWSVPQKRPPVCIPDNDKQSTVKAIYDKGTPVDALDWVKSGAILPQTEYTEKYNENYYYPGWKAQEHIEYPFDKNSKGHQEYYNYNLAKSVE